ncbi:MAG: class II aldolase/adducin family protein [Candidatus Omnitrophica bacterium]|nr:class II aldolase/adducin family protein [Candidatus Omnitrophota bacterium]
MDEGIIKFQCEWKKDQPISFDQLKEIRKWRQWLYDHKLIGVCPEGIGFGNVSVRAGNRNEFIITGSQTGHLAKLEPEHYTLVCGWDIPKNAVTCRGPIQASSESLTHAMVYAMDNQIGAVIHGHSRPLWQKLLNRVPTSSKEVTYGTPEMAEEVRRLFRETDLPEKKIFVMGGHEEGILVFGKDLNEAGRILKQYPEKS